MALNPVELIDKYVNTAFDDVKKVADNIDTVVNAGEIADTHQVAAADPILRANGDALQVGDTYFHTIQDIRYTYNGTIWVAESTHDAAVTATAASQAAAAISETNAEASNVAAGIAQVAAELAETNAETAQTAAELAETNAAASAALILNGVGANVASAAALPLINDGNQFTVTGTATITSMNTLGVGKVIYLRFVNALTITHHATDLILPGGVNITTVAGDMAIFHEYATGDWRLLNFLRDNPILYAPNVAPAGYVKFGNHYIIDGSSSAAPAFNVHSSITVGTFESVGPTGSGATNTWPAMDAMPANATAALFGILTQLNLTGTGTRSIDVYGASNAIAVPLVNGAVTGLTTHGNDADTGDVTEMQVTVMCPVDANQVMKIGWAVSGTTTSTELVILYWRGWITD